MKTQQGVGMEPVTQKGLPAPALPGGHPQRPLSALSTSVVVLVVTEPPAETCVNIPSPHLKLSPGPVSQAHTDPRPTLTFHAPFCFSYRLLGQYLGKSGVRMGVGCPSSHGTVLFHG